MTENLPTVNEMLGDPPPTTDERVIAVYRGVLEAGAIAAASAAGELLLCCLEQRDRGEPYKADPALVDEFTSSIAQLDRAWCGFIGRVQRPAGPIVASAVESYLGHDIAFIVEHALEHYRRGCIVALEERLAAERAASHDVGP